MASTGFATLSRCSRNGRVASRRVGSSLILATALAPGVPARVDPICKTARL
jgi:hypothetical protein